MADDNKTNMIAQSLFSNWFGEPDEKDTTNSESPTISRNDVDDSDQDLVSIIEEYDAKKNQDNELKSALNINNNKTTMNNNMTPKGTDQKTNTTTRRKLERHEIALDELEDALPGVPTTQVASTEIKKPIEPLHKEVKSVDIAISGSTYNVNCYVDEIVDLNKAVDYINDFIRDLRKDAPTLEHENLLVLCCLNMYEEMKQEEKQRRHLEEIQKKAQSLIGKINKDVQGILP